MQIEILSLLDGAAKARGTVIIIDVFRAFATACYALESSPRDYLLVESSERARHLSREVDSPFLIGKAELGSDLRYNIPNSPTRVLSQSLCGRTVLHRTGAGARGIISAGLADRVLTGAFVNAAAIVRYVLLQPPALVSLVAMGHEGERPSLEDELCARLIAARLQGHAFELEPYEALLRSGPGKYFFEATQEEYPQEDFARCLEVDRFPFVLRAERFSNYARLERIDV